MDRTDLEKLDRESLVTRATAAGIKRARVLTRPELIDELLRLDPIIDETALKRSRGFFGRARDLLSKVVERGLHLPDAAERWRGVLNPYPSVPRPEPQAVPTVTLAEIYAAQGHTDRAIETLQRVLEAEPDHGAARALLERLEATDYVRPDPPPLPPEVDTTAAPPEEEDAEGVLSTKILDIPKLDAVADAEAEAETDAEAEARRRAAAETDAIRRASTEVDTAVYTPPSTGSHADVDARRQAPTEVDTAVYTQGANGDHGHRRAPSEDAAGYARGADGDHGHRRAAAEVDTAGYVEAFDGGHEARRRAAEVAAASSAAEGAVVPRLDSIDVDDAATTNVYVRGLHGDAGSPPSVAEPFEVVDSGKLEDEVTSVAPLPDPVVTPSATVAMARPECVALPTKPGAIFVWWNVAAVEAFVVRALVIVPTWDGPRQVVRDIACNASDGELLLEGIPQGAVTRVAIGTRSEQGFVPIAHSPAIEVEQGELVLWTLDGYRPASSDLIAEARARTTTARS